MPATACWTYKTTVKPAHPSSPSTVVSVSAPLPPSNNTLFASSSFQVRLKVHAGESEIDGPDLGESALARVVRDWFNKHKDSLGVDGAHFDEGSAASVTIRLNAFSRSARSSTLALPTRIATPNQPPSLDHLDLALLFRLPRSISSASHAQGTASQPNSQEQTHLDLVSQLLHPETLHFTLKPLVSSALERVAKKLLAAFPLCFNPRWVDRLSNDSSSYRSVANSLSKILNLADDKTSSVEKDVETSAAMLSLTLSTHISLYHADPYDVPPATASSTLSQDARVALKTAILVVAKDGSTPDPWQPSAAAAQKDGGTSAGAKANAEKKRVLPVNKERVEGKKRRLFRDQDDQADFSALHDFDESASDQPVDQPFFSLTRDNAPFSDEDDEIRYGQEEEVEEDFHMREGAMEKEDEEDQAGVLCGGEVGCDRTSAMTEESDDLLLT
ncbi:hypothetical protein JCM11251_006838 [Rhodosporidiobolus azoricus]